MSATPIELAAEQVIIEMLKRSLPDDILVLPAIGDRDITGKTRILVKAEDMGHELSVKVAGVYARKIRVTATLRTMIDDHDADWMETESVTVTNALDHPISPLASIAPFKWFSIIERSTSNLSFDKRQWMKSFTLDITALLAS